MILVKNIMTTEVVTVKEETPIYEALNLFKRHEISGLPVVNDDMELIGILTEKDVLSLLLNARLPVNAMVSKYMNRRVVSFKENDNVIDVCQFFIKSPIRRVPIVRDKKLVGVVARRDIVELILEMRSKISDYRFS